MSEELIAQAIQEIQLFGEMADALAASVAEMGEAGAGAGLGEIVIEWDVAEPGE